MTVFETKIVVIKNATDEPITVDIKWAEKPGNNPWPWYTADGYKMRPGEETLLLRPGTR